MGARAKGNGVHRAIRRSVLLGLLAACLLGVLPQTATASTVSVVTIGGRHYLTGNAVTLASRLIRTPAISFVLSASQACQGFRGRVFASTSGVGVTAYVPLSLPGCVGTTGGGPGGPSGGPCLQVFKTPLGGQVRYYVLFAATSSTVCADISTQVPGGVWARTRASVPGLPAGSAALVKCQWPSPEGLFDYLAPPSSTLPASKPTYWLNDYYFAGRRLAGVPACYGVSVS